MRYLLFLMLGLTSFGVKAADKPNPCDPASNFGNKASFKSSPVCCVETDPNSKISHFTKITFAKDVTDADNCKMQRSCGNGRLISAVNFFTSKIDSTKDFYMNVNPNDTSYLELDACEEHFAKPIPIADKLVQAPQTVQE